MSGAIYSGRVKHRRYDPFPHSFTYGLFMVYLNVDEIEQVLDNSLLWNTNGKAIVEFRRSDYLFDPSISIGEEMRNIVEKNTGTRPSGTIYMLTHPRYFGYIFNPVTLYYCYNQDHERIETIVAEITNTPWKEKYCYVLSTKGDTDSHGKHHFILDKNLHISPFIDMNHQYNWRFTDPGKSLTVYMENHTKGEKYFDVTLTMKRQPLSKKTLRKAVIAYPVMTMKVTAAIYWQAFKLWLKGAPFYSHPK